MLRITILFILTHGLPDFLFGQKLTGQVFILTEDFLEETCEAIAQCDCCSTDLFFLSDKEFAMVDRCLYNDSYYKGTYLISDNKLTLTFNQKVVNEIFDEQTNKVKHEVKKIKVTPDILIISACKNKVRLKNTSTDGFKNGSRYSSTKEKEELKKLKERPAWKLISE